MWTFLSYRVRRWLLMVVGLPLLAWLFGSIGRSLERRRGESPITRTFTGAERLISNRGRRRHRHRF